eukprot:GHVN01076027.1.p1 GENE.GHVN01076027.1~~GHVN01076027.1.p1  ORF type:complete len:368 (+),score=55.90 GHVN01076027.1:74-1177(+)
MWQPWRKPPVFKPTKAQAKIQSRLPPPRYTHFLSIPLLHTHHDRPSDSQSMAPFGDGESPPSSASSPPSPPPPYYNSELLGSLTEFKDKIHTISRRFGGVDETCFIRLKRFHFTLFMLRLPSDETIKKAKAVIDEAFDEDVPQLMKKWGPSHTRAALSGLYAMESDVSKARIIYTCDPDNSDLQTAVNELTSVLVNKFKAAGLTDDDDLRSQRMDPAEPNIKLHATLINLKYRSNNLKWRQKERGLTKEDHLQPQPAKGGSESNEELESDTTMLVGETDESSAKRESAMVGGNETHNDKILTPKWFMRSFDATPLLDEYVKSGFGHATMRQLHLSVLGPATGNEVQPPHCDGYYNCSAYAYIKVPDG